MSDKKNPGALLYLAIFLLSWIEFMQAGMTAFAAAPTMGELSITPEEFNLIAASYAAAAILSISMQRWFVERVGGQRFVQMCAVVSVCGSVICASSQDFTGFMLGRVVMGLGGGAFFTASRMIIHHVLVGPKRFLGIRSLAFGVALGISISPWLASVAVSNEHWSAIYWFLAGTGVAIFALACLTLPKAPIGSSKESKTSFWEQLLLAGSSFVLLYALQRLYYDFYGNVEVIVLVGVAAFLCLAAYFTCLHVRTSPLLRIREMLSPRYAFGLGIFFFAYVMLGANNFAIGSLLQGSLGYGWATVGKIEALGLCAAVLTWMVLERVMPKFPSPRKFLVVGFSALATFGFLLSAVTPDANLWVDALPALACNSIFLLTVLPVNAMQTFRDVEKDEPVFSHAQQLKSMMAQAGSAVGITLATLIQQTRSAQHYSTLVERVSPSNPIYAQTIQRLQEAQASTLAPADAARVALAQVGQMLSQQASLMASIDHFMLIGWLGLFGIAVILTQRIFR